MVNFATDPGTDVFIRGIDAGERARKARQAVAVDTAVRRGLAQSFGGQDAPPLAPSPAADAAPQAAPATPTLAPAPATPAQDAPETPPGGIPVPPVPPSSPPPRAAPAPALAPRAPMPAAMPAGGDRYAPVLRELSQVEGGGAAALDVMQRQDRTSALMGRRQDQLARLAMYALSKGDTATGQYFANQAGIPLPQIQPGRGRGGAGGATPQQARLLGTAALAARRLYGNDVGQAQRFTQAYIQNGGDIGAAIAAAGDPTQGPIAQWRWRQNAQTGQEELVGVRRDGTMSPIADDDGQPFVRAPQQRVMPGQNGYVTVNPQDGTARPVTGQDGRQVQPPARGGGGVAGAGGRPLNIEAKRQMLIEAGLSPQEASLAAAGGTLSPAARAQLYVRIQSAVNADMMIPADKKAGEVDRRFRDLEMKFGGGNAASPTPAPALPRAPADGPAPALAPNPAPAAQPPAAMAAPRGVPEGAVIRQNGVRYRVRAGQLEPIQ